MEKMPSVDDLRNFLREVVYKINRQSFLSFELNETVGYFSIQVAGKKKNTNVVCFVKDEPVLSINVNAIIKKSLFENPPYNKLKLRPSPPPGLQLRKESWYQYPYHVEYDFKTDKELILQLCQQACEHFIK